MSTATIDRPSSREPFGQAPRRWRERRRVSQLELALRAGTTQRHLSFIEQGRSAPGRSMVTRLAESLKLPLRDRNVLLWHARAHSTRDWSLSTTTKTAPLSRPGAGQPTPERPSLAAGLALVEASDGEPACRGQAAEEEGGGEDEECAAETCGADRGEEVADAVPSVAHGGGQCCAGERDDLDGEEGE